MQGVKMEMRYDIFPMYACKMKIRYYIYFLQVYGIGM